MLKRADGKHPEPERVGMSHVRIRACNLPVLVSAFICFACLYTVPCAGSELKKETVAAFNEYVKATEGRMAEELRADRAFLYPDTSPGQNRDTIYDRLRRGEIFVTRLETTIQGRRIAVPNGIIHHWVGIAYIPSTNMRDVLRVAQRLRTSYGGVQTGCDCLKVDMA